MRIPFSFKYNNRVGNTLKDARRINVIDEPGEGEVYVLKRPAFIAQLLNNNLGFGQGCTYFNGSFFSVCGDVLNIAPTPPNSGSTGVTWNVSGVGTQPWSPRLGHAIVTLNDTLFLMGGADANGPKNDIWATTDSLTWKSMLSAAPWPQRQNFGCCVFNGLIFVFGGFNGLTNTFFNDCWSSPDGVAWTQLTSGASWSPRASFSCTSGNNGIYLFGGVANTPVANTFLNEIWFSQNGITWSKIITSGTLWSVRLSSMAFWYNRKYYVVGGIGPANLQLNDCWSSPDGQIWTLLTNAAFTQAAGGLAYSAYTVYANKMWVINGESGVGTAQNCIYTSTTGSSWTKVTGASTLGANYGGAVTVFKTPIQLSPARYNTLWYGGGYTGVTYNGNIGFSSLDTTIGTSFALNPATTGQQYYFNSFSEGRRLFIKNQSNAWVWDAGVLTPITDPAYPITTAAGVAVLNDQVYVMDPTGLIQNCDFNNPYLWPSINAIGADYEDDPGVCLVKYQNYVVAFGTFTYQYFYDAGVSPGSPLLPYQSANTKIGLFDALSVAPVGDTWCFLGRTPDNRIRAFMLQGLQAQPISDIYLEKILANAFPEGDTFVGFCTYACGFSGAGHQFYLVGFSQEGTSRPTVWWVYDVSSKKWAEWNGLNGLNPASGGFVGQCAANDQTFEGSFVQLYTDGDVYRLDVVYQDQSNNSAGGGGTVASNIVVTLRTANQEAGTRKKKFWGRTDVLSDINPGTPLIQYSDNDYATFSTGRTVDLSQDRPALFNNGSSRRRAFLYTQNDANPMRVVGLDVEVEVTDEGLGK